MKKHGNLFQKIVDIDNIRLAFMRARRGKSWQHTVKRIETDLDERLPLLRQSLVHKTFTTSPYRQRRIFEPKERLIYKLPFYPDRIVQHALMNVVEPIWDALFIHHSYACRTGKGIHSGSRLTMEFVRKHRYCLKCDISKFYPSLDHEILFRIIQRKIKCSDTLWLIHDIIHSFPGGKNVPIGNYTSQWFGNLYLNELDQFLKHQYKIKAYLRYCDDFCLFHDDKAFLSEMAKVIKEFLSERLLLSMSKCDLFPVSRGVDFLGYRHFKDYILLRKSTARRVKKRLLALPILLSKDLISIEIYRSSLASTMGWLKWANSHNYTKSIDIERLWNECQTV